MASKPRPRWAAARASVQPIRPRVLTVPWYCTGWPASTSASVNAAALRAAADGGRGSTRWAWELSAMR